MCQQQIDATCSPIVHSVLISLSLSLPSPVSHLRQAQARPALHVVPGRDVGGAVHGEGKTGSLDGFFHIKDRVLEQVRELGRSLFLHGRRRHGLEGVWRGWKEATASVCWWSPVRVVCGRRRKQWRGLLGNRNSLVEGPRRDRFRIGVADALLVLLWYAWAVGVGGKVRRQASGLTGPSSSPVPVWTGFGECGTLPLSSEQDQDHHIARQGKASNKVHYKVPNTTQLHFLSPPIPIFACLLAFRLYFGFFILPSSSLSHRRVDGTRLTPGRGAAAQHPARAA